MRMHIIALVAISIFSTIVSCNNKDTKAESSSLGRMPEANTETPATEISTPQSALTYNVIWESNNRRYDNAHMYIVTTDKNTHEHMHNLVDEFARKNSTKKFTLIAFDNEKAAQVYKASHYGTNEVNRIATKAELKLMDKHIIGTYNGELEANGNPYEIMYHGFGFGEDEVEDFEPHL